RALFTGTQQAQLVVLTVHGQQLLREISERSHRYGPAAEMRPRTSVRTDRTQRDHTAVFVPAAPGIIDNAFRSGHLPRIEAALHTRATTSGPHLRRVRTATGQQ